MERQDNKKQHLREYGNTRRRRGGFRMRMMWRGGDRRLRQLCRRCCTDLECQSIWGANKGTCVSVEDRTSGVDWFFVVQIGGLGRRGAL